MVKFLFPQHPPGYLDSNGNNLAARAWNLGRMEIYQYLCDAGMEPIHGGPKIHPLALRTQSQHNYEQILDQVGNPLIDPMVGYLCTCTTPPHEYQKDICPSLLISQISNLDRVQSLLGRGIGYTYT